MFLDPTCDKSLAESDQRIKESSPFFFYQSCLSHKIAKKLAKFLFKSTREAEKSAESLRQCDEK